jgi:hypothetical protein
VAEPAPGRPVEPADAQPAPAPSRPQPSQPVETLRQGPRPVPTPAGGAAIPEQSTPSPPTNTATVQAPTIPSATAAEPPASTSAARDNAPQPNQTPPSAVTTSAPAAENRVVPQKPDISVSSPAKPSVAATDDEAAIRGVLRAYEQAIETKDIALYRSIRPRLTPTEEALLRNSFRQVDSQEVTIRVDSLNIDGRVATVRIVRQDTLVTGGRRQVQNTTQTLQFEKTASGWVIN